MEKLYSTRLRASCALSDYRTACLDGLDTSDLSGSPELIGRMFEELSSIDELEKMLKESRSVVEKTMTMLTSYSPLLPDEVWAHIFRMVCNTTPCDLQGMGSNQKIISRGYYLESLSHVCSRWRSIIIELPCLWNHIDILHCHTSSERFFARGLVFISRSRNLPIHLHVASFGNSTPESDSKLDEFCAHLFGRIHTLEVICPGDRLDNSSQAVVQACLSSCQPGVLQQLSLAHFCGVSDRSIGQLSRSQELIEDVMEFVKILSLSGYYFPHLRKTWNSLIELSLCAPKDDCAYYLRQSDISQLLASCPQLSALHFGTGISDNNIIRSIPPIPLTDLEVLDLRWSGHRNYGALFSLISPTKRPLRVLLRYRFTNSSPLNSSRTRHFFLHSNIIHLSMKGPTGAVWILRLLALLPQLRVLTLIGSTLDSRSSTIPPNTSSFSRLSLLEKLRLVHCSISIYQLRNIAQVDPIKTLIVQDCNIGNYEISGEDLVGIAPEIHFIDSSGSNSRIQDWDENF
ncbi:F-box-like protein [Rhizoctonia solani]|uniref:F-box-like protein n=1 Tax=Rhizoctonia solani TaxID=456999 RepID=A0A8H8P6Q1_9AGAM|nr:F-box-like protein [Rhizoctonia solani]QRW25728.1 F-box-like protein [Rhizoctonia solani]